MKLERPLIFFDVEGTGTDPVKDRIVSLAVVKLFPAEDGVENEQAPFDVLCNPGFAMSDEVISVHGITNEMAARAPEFSAVAHDIYKHFHGCDLAGFNLFNYDIPILWEELNRAGIEWSLEGVHVIDAGNIFKKKEARTLSAAMKFYCDVEHSCAHNALGDAQATRQVLDGQLRRYPDLATLSLAELAQFSKMDDRIDLAGKIVKNEKGEAVYNFGKSKGVRVLDDPSFGYWILGRDFSENTKTVLRSILYNSPV